MAQCRRKARQDDSEVREPPTGKRGSDYSYWFYQAYPHPQQRREYLRSLIKNQALSPASLRLAHVLMTRQVADTVVTPNFDDFISRALALFGEANLSLCDHPRITDRIEPEEDDIKIVQVHGSYHIYDLANIQDELTDRAAPSSETTLTMSSLLDRLFASRGALIIGYSGWDGDAIMEAMKRRLVGQGLPYNVYFFCYRRSNRDELPEWIKNHQNVRFVVPPEEKTKILEFGVAEGAGRLDLDRLDTTARLIAEPPTGDSSGEPTLHAKDILDALIRRLKLAPPALVTDPLEFFERQLTQASLPKSEQDPYSFLNIAGQIRTAKVLLAELESRKQRAVIRLESVRDALRRSQYAEAIQIACDIDVIQITPEQGAELLQALILAASGLTGESDVISAAERIDAVFSAGVITPSRLEEFAAPVAQSMNRKSTIMSHLERLPEALQVLNDLIGRFAHYSNPDLQEEVAKALFNKGTVLGRLGRSEEELGAYDDPLRRFAEAPGPALRERVAWTLYNKTIILGEVKGSEEALGAYDDLLRRFADAPEPALRESVARALLYKGMTLRQVGRRDQAKTCLTEGIRRFGESLDSATREIVAQTKKLLEELEEPEAQK
jgi:tetratricopeptide (TPR) repeat protein